MSSQLKKHNYPANRKKSELKKHNYPLVRKKSNKPIWNKGLPKEKQPFFGKHHNEESKSKISKSTSITKQHQKEIGIFSNRDYSIGKNSRIYTSKQEREIVNYFKTNFPEYQWKSGGSLKYNNIRIVRDLWSDVLKICFEYDGIWHFKDIHNQLKNKQLKDKMLEEWCIKNNYRLIRIDELKYENLKQIEDLIFNRNEQIIKIGNRYENFFE